MPILSYCTTPEGLLIETDCGRLAITPRTSRCIRVRYTLGAGFSNRVSLMVLPEQQGPAGAVVPAFAVREDATALTFSTDHVVVTIDRRTAAFEYRDRDGVLLTREPGRGGKTLEPVDVLVSQFDDQTVDVAPSVDGLRMAARSVRQVVDRKAYRAKLEFVWADGEALYGLGSHEEGMLNLRGQHQYLYQQNMKAVVPALVSTRGYGILLDNYSLMTFHDDAFGSYLWMEVAAELDYYFVYGPQFDDIIRELRDLTGHVPMLPRWAFGYIQSKERYVSQAELIAVVAEYRGRGLPLDCIVLDWKSWPGDLWGQKSFDPARFPDPDEMTAELHRMNARLMISIWPIMRPGGSDWTGMRERGYLLGNQATYNAFDEGARARYWQQAQDGLWSHGVDAWWCDCTEPFEADWQGAVKPEPEARMLINAGEAKRYLDPEFINAYSLLHSQGIYEGQRAASPDRRVVNLTRSAYMGQQRYGTVTWSGDVAATWETLRRQIAEGLNFCATGCPHWTTDIGAFFAARKPDLWFWNGDFDTALDGYGRVADLGYRELYARWFQFAAFLPMFRSHGTDIPREVWRFGAPDDRCAFGASVYDALVKALRLRYRLLPYIYSLAGWTTLRAYTMLRNLAFDFAADPAAHDVAGEFMFGPAFLVAPVTEPMYYGPGSAPLESAPRSRRVYLPAGSDWFNFWTGEVFAGGQAIEVAAPIDTLPLFVRAGSIVPMGPVLQYAEEVKDAPLVVHVYEGADAAFDFYDDEGDGYNYERGSYTIAPIRWHDASRQLTIARREGSFAGMPVLRELTVALHGRHGETMEHGPLVYDGAPLLVQF